MNLPIDSIAIGERHRQDLGDLDSLAESIRKVGLLHPVVVDADHRLIAGQRRLEAVRKIGMDSVPVTVVDGLSDAADALMAERDENTCRKPMTPSEAVLLGRELEELVRPLAHKNKRESGGPVESTRPLRPVDRIDTRAVAAAGVGMSPSRYREAKTIVEAAESRDPVGVQAKRDMDETGNVHGALRYLKGEAPPVSQRPPQTSRGPKMNKRSTDQLLEGTFHSLGAVLMTLRTMDMTDIAVEPDRGKEWCGELDEVIRLLRALRTALREGGAI